MKCASRIAILILAGAVFASCYQRDALPNDQPFDSIKWRTGDLRARGRMAHDLQRSKLLGGKTKAEVKMLLGNPDSPPDAPNFYYRVDLGARFLGQVRTSKLNVNFDAETQRAIGAIFTE